MKRYVFVALLAILTGLALLLRLSTLAPELSIALDPTPPQDRVARPAVVETAVLGSASRTAVAFTVEHPVLQEGARGFISGAVEDVYGSSIPGASCQLVPGRSPAGLGSLVYREEEPRAIHGSCRTDAAGAFRIAVPPGFWTLRVEAEGRAPYEEDYLRPGDFRSIRLSPARELAVLVEDDRGLAVADANVRVLRGEYYDPRGAILSAPTDGAGMALFKNVPCGTWFVHVRHATFVGTTIKAPEAREGRAELRVVLGRGIRVTGRIIRADGQPVREPAYVQFDTYDGFLSSHETRSDSDGRYASEVAFAPGFPIEVAAIVPSFGEARERVDLSDLPPTSEVVRIDLFVESIERSAVGVVQDRNGAPLEGIEVFVEPLTSLPPENVIHIPSEAELERTGSPDLAAYDPVESKVARARSAGQSDAHGRFRVGGLHASMAYKLLLVSEEHSNAVLWCETGEPGETIDLGVVRLAPAGRVWGHVRRPDGSPIEGELVYVVSLTTRHIVPDSEYSVERPQSQVGLLDSITNADGLFAIEPLPDASFMLMCLGTLFGPYSTEAGESLGPLVLETEDVHRKSASRAVPVTLQVMDETGAPIENSFVTLRRILGESDESGLPQLNDVRYMRGDEYGAVHTDAVPGRYELVVLDMTGRCATQISEVVLEGFEPLVEDAYLSFEAFPPGVLEGSVTDAFGAPLAGMEIALIPATGDISCNCMKLTVATDEAGRFSFGSFMKGNHRILVTDPEQRRAPTQHYPVRSGQPIAITMD